MTDTIAQRRASRPLSPVHEIYDLLRTFEQMQYVQLDRYGDGYSHGMCNGDGFGSERAYGGGQGDGDDLGNRHGGSWTDGYPGEFRVS